MNVIKKYWDAVYIYILLLVPGFCMCAGTFWTVCKLAGLYPDLQWIKIIVFDCSQIIYLTIALYFIYQNRKEASYITERLNCVKGFIVFALFVQYNFILYLFPSEHVWECTFLFFAIIAFLFDSKLMFLNIVLYFLSLFMAHISNSAEFLPLEKGNLEEIIAFRITIFILTAFCIMVIVYFVERFLIQAKESNEENVHLLEKQLKYYRDMELFDEEIRKFRHDIKNHFIVIEALFKSEKTAEVQKYFQDLIESFTFKEKLYVSGNDIIDAILHHELSYSCREEVKITVYGSLPDIKTISSMDLCTLFANMLSNAITSINQCVESLEPKLTIRFLSGDTYFSIVIINSAIWQNNGKKRKKKDRNHGYGIYKIKSIVEKYNGRFEQNVEQNMVTTTVYLPI